MHNLSDMHEHCKQCNFRYARIDTEGWGSNSVLRVMCPVCGWTRFVEHTWKDGQPQLVQSSESRGFGAYRLVASCTFAGYNAFHSVPDEEVVAQIKELLNVKGWKGYLSLWDESAGRARLVAGSPLHKLNVVSKLGAR